MAGQFLDASVIQVVSLWVVKVQRAGSAARLCRRGPIDADHGAAVAVPQSQQLVEHPSRQAADPFRDQFHANCLKVTQPDFDGRDGEVIQRAVLESGFAWSEHVSATLNGCKVDGATREPRPL